MMGRVRDAIDRNDLPAALGFALADKMVKAEIDRLNTAVCERFGDRALLGLDARSIATQLPAAQKVRLAEAWPTLRAAQQLAAHERTVSGDGTDADGEARTG
jgi:hypothetical protein